jgi:hypothetical protein
MAITQCFHLQQQMVVAREVVSLLLVIQVVLAVEVEVGK